MGSPANFVEIPANFFIIRATYLGIPIFIDIKPLNKFGDIISKALGDNI